MGDRCTGDCCREFELPVTRADLAALAFWRLVLPANWTRELFETGADYAKTATMIRPVRLIAPGELRPDGTVNETTAAIQIWTCVHFDGANCTAYEARPRMCSEYPYGKPCGYGEACAWDAGRAGEHPPKDGKRRLVLAVEA